MATLILKMIFELRDIQPRIRPPPTEHTLQNSEGISDVTY